MDYLVGATVFFGVGGVAGMVAGFAAHLAKAAKRTVFVLAALTGTLAAVAIGLIVAIVPEGNLLLIPVSIIGGLLGASAAGWAMASIRRAAP